MAELPEPAVASYRQVLKGLKDGAIPVYQSFYEDDYDVENMIQISLGAPEINIALTESTY